MYILWQKTYQHCGLYITVVTCILVLCLMCTCTPSALGLVAFRFQGCTYQTNYNICMYHFDTSQVKGNPRDIHVYLKYTLGTHNISCCHGYQSCMKLFFEVFIVPYLVNAFYYNIILFQWCIFNGIGKVKFLVYLLLMWVDVLCNIVALWYILVTT